MKIAATLGATSQEVLERAVQLMDALDLHPLADDLILAVQSRFADQAWARQVSVRRLWQSDRNAEAQIEIERAERELGALDPALMRLRALVQISAQQPDLAIKTLQALQQTAANGGKENDATRAWTQAVISALYDAFGAKTELTTEQILEALRQTVPLARTMDEQINRLRSWAVGRARNASLVRSG